jgi:hypothetical protein
MDKGSLYIRVKEPTLYLENVLDNTIKCYRGRNFHYKVRNIYNFLLETTEYLSTIITCLLFLYVDITSEEDKQHQLIDHKSLTPLASHQGHR